MKMRSAKSICLTAFVLIATLALLQIDLRGQTLADGLLLYLPLKEDLADHGPAALAMVNKHGVSMVDGAAYFDGGKDNWLEAPSLPVNGKPFAISMWIRPTGTHPMYGLIEQKDADRGNRWLHVMLRGGRQPYLGFYINDAISPRDIPVNQWSHLLFQYREGRQEIWVNGSFMCARKTKAYGGKGGTLRIGYTPPWNNVPSRNFEGFMRELRIYGRALANDEILALFTGKRSPAQTAASNAGLEPMLDLPTVAQETPATINGAPFLSIDGNRLLITGEARQTYEVQFTLDLGKEWQPLTTLTNRLGTIEYEDTTRSNGVKFYRIKVVQPQ